MPSPVEVVGGRTGFRGRGISIVNAEGRMLSFVLPPLDGGTAPVSWEVQDGRPGLSSRLLVLGMALAALPSALAGTGSWTIPLAEAGATVAIALCLRLPALRGLRRRHALEHRVVAAAQAGLPAEAGSLRGVLPYSTACGSRFALLVPLLGLGVPLGVLGLAASTGAVLYANARMVDLPDGHPFGRLLGFSVDPWLSDSEAELGAAMLATAYEQLGGH